MLLRHTGITSGGAALTLAVVSFGGKADIKEASIFVRLTRYGEPTLSCTQLARTASIAYRPANKNDRMEKKDAGPPRPAPFKGYGAPPAGVCPLPEGGDPLRIAESRSTKKPNAAHGTPLARGQKSIVN
jgi:hypothetical protein